MGVHSGRYALVNGQGSLRQWSISDNHTAAEAVTSQTAFGKARRPGVRSWQGSLQMFGGDDAIALPGSTISFSGYTAPDNDGYGNGVLYSGSALINQMILNFNFTGGEMINGQLDFAGHLGLSSASAAPPLDATTPDFEQIANASIMYSTDGGTTWQAWPNVSTATWTLTNALQSYVNSSTVVSNFLWTGQKPGIIDWNLNVTEQDNIRTKFQIGDQIALKLYVTASTFWLLKYGQVKDFTNIQINRETGAIISQTVTIEMDGVKVSDGSLGTITTPANVVYWPVAQS